MKTLLIMVSSVLLAGTLLSSSNGAYCAFFLAPLIVFRWTLRDPSCPIPGRKPTR